MMADIMKLIAALRNFTKAPKNQQYLSFINPLTFMNSQNFVTIV